MKESLINLELNKNKEIEEFRSRWEEEKEMEFDQMKQNWEIKIKE